MKELNLKTLLAGINPVSISEYTVVADNLARVIVNIPRMSKEATLARVTAALQGKAQAIPGSFSWLVPGSSMLGYVCASRTTRDLQDREKYQVVASNMLMDPSDHTLWEVKEGAGGTYLARQGHDNLADLLEASRTPPMGSTPRMASVMQASAAKNEFITYVHASTFSTPTVEFGFCLNSPQSEHLMVASPLSSKPIPVAKDLVVSSHVIDIMPIQKNILAGSKMTAADLAALSPEEYWKKAYSYSDEYIQMILKQVSEHRSA